MDPDEVLRLLRLTAAQLKVDDRASTKLAHAEELVEHFTALDQWLRKGGFLPGDWTAAKSRREERD